MQPPFSTTSRPDRRWTVIVVLFMTIVVLAGAGFFYWFYQVDQGLHQFELEGTWELKLPEGWVVTKRGILVKQFAQNKIYDARMVREAGEQKVYERQEWASYSIDPKNKTIDITFPSGEVWPGIYVINGDELTICYTSPDKERPTKIEKNPDYRFMVLRLVSKAG